MLGSRRYSCTWTCHHHHALFPASFHPPLPSTPQFSFASYHTFPSPLPDTPRPAITIPAPSLLHHASHSSPLFHHSHHMSSMFPLASRVHLSVRHASQFVPNIVSESLSPLSLALIMSPCNTLHSRHGFAAAPESSLQSCVARTA